MEGLELSLKPQNREKMFSSHRTRYGELQEDGSCRKKQKKKDKVRRRGPGVAELEKIRLQEESRSSLPHTLFPPLYATTHPIFRPPVTQHSLHHHTMNLSNPMSGPREFYQFVEPPSNQRSCLRISQFSEKEKEMVCAKRPWRLLTDTSTSTKTISRDVKPNRSPDMRLISPVQDFGSPTFILSFPHSYPLSLRYGQQQGLDENAQMTSMKPFYSFIASDDRVNGDQEQQASDPHESASDDGIDLSLKL